MWNQQRHSYEELRQIVIDVLLQRERTDFPPEQWANLMDGVKQVMTKRAGVPSGAQEARHRMHPEDAELVRDIFWDLFRQGFITLGLNDSNPTWPFFRLSAFGAKALSSQAPFRFHDTTSFLEMVLREVPDLSTEAQTYLSEAVASFYADCMLASTVMLGVAAEAEFLRLLDVIAAGSFAGKFSAAQKAFFIRKKIEVFHNCLEPIQSALPNGAVENIETNLTAIQAVLRVARNDAGHPSGANPQREQVYVFLQLFAPFARQLMRLREALA